MSGVLGRGFVSECSSSGLCKQSLLRSFLMRRTSDSGHSARPSGELRFYEQFTDSFCPPVAGMRFNQDANYFF